MEEKKKTYTVVALGGGGALLVLKRGVMLAALEVDGAHKRPQMGCLKWTEQKSLASRMAARCKITTVSCTGYKM